MRNYRMTLCYDGTRYRGWQKQGNTDRTIQGKLETLLSRLLDQTVEVQGSGRTDAGVHALGQIASFKADTSMTCPQLLAAIREYLPDDIGAVSLEDAPPRFHARLSAREKTYVYRIWNSEQPCVFERRYVYVFPRHLDLEAMRRAAGALCGHHDFSAFSSGKKTGRAAERTLRSVTVERVGEEVRLTFSGDGFLYNMVRIITGTLLEVGTGERDPGSMTVLLDSRVRAGAGFTVPAAGLCLVSVKYDPEGK